MTTDTMRQQTEARMTRGHAEELVERLGFELRPGSVEEVRDRIAQEVGDSDGVPDERLQPIVEDVASSSDLLRDVAETFK